VGNQSGDTTTVEIITEGETFGEAVAFLGEPYPVTATALAASTLYFVSTVFVDAIVATDQQTVRRLLANLSRRNHQLIGDIAALTLATARQRLSHYLLQLDRRPLNSSGLVEVVLSDPKKVIASRLNLTPEALSRTLRRLADEGLITVTGKKVQLMPEQLTVAAR
jgi:CRP-like cAMP-binding protein